MLQTTLESTLRFLARRKTERELALLDDRMLADIGLERGDIHRAAAEVTGTPIHNNSSLWTVWLSRLQRASARAGLVSSLHRLPDHVLNDIGIPRGQIEASVYRIMAQTPVKAKAPRTGTIQVSPVHGLLHRIEAATWPFRRAHANRPAAAANSNHAQAEVA